MGNQEAAASAAEQSSDERLGQEREQRLGDGSTSCQLSSGSQQLVLRTRVGGVSPQDVQLNPGLGPRGSALGLADPLTSLWLTPPLHGSPRAVRAHILKTLTPAPPDPLCASAASTTHSDAAIPLTLMLALSLGLCA